MLEERESDVGKYSVDIYGKEEGTDRKVVIENQLEDSNHDHLGKIITYASGKDAKTIIWIVKRARDEHRQAMGNGTERNHKLSEYYLKIAKQAGLKRAIDKYEEYEFGEER